MLNHSRQSGWVHLPDGMNLIALHFPEGKLPEELATPVRRNGRVIINRHGEGDVLGGFVELVTRSLDELSAGSERLLADQLVGLVALALRRHEVVDVRQAPKHEAERGQLQTVWSLIEQHLHRPELIAEEVAGRLGLSERHFYRLLKRNGISFRSELLKRRLERAAGELADPGLAHLSINAIALGNGFASASHFARVSRQQFGCTPSD
nr:helix-turn-helix transcriptional regulator [Thioalkalivibrio sp. ALE11]